MVSKYSVRRTGLNASCDILPGTLEREFVNRLSSVVNNVIRDKTSSEIDKFRFSYLLQEVSSKSPFCAAGVAGPERAAAAIAKTLKSNQHCADVNSSVLWDEPDVRRFLERARRIVKQILGTFSYAVYGDSTFSGGASTTHRYGLSSPFYKYASVEYGYLEVTREAESRLCALIENTPALYRCFLRSKFMGLDSIKITDCDRVTTVPKNASIDRTILMQPAGLNLLQKALGKAIRERLLKVGVDLRDQTTNQQLARVGSLRRSHATIDLSSASDTLNARIVWELIPDDWYRELEALRCTYGKYKDPLTGKDTYVTWSMFSAMGNAFTFELESLIFYAVSKAACDELGSYVGRINVFGDDIIVPNSCAMNVCERLTLCGFIVNDKKTHIDGNFRESCGAHWYSGVCVKPFYIRTALTRLDEIIRLANQLRKWSADDKVCDPRLYKLWCFLAAYIPSMLHGGFDLESSYALVTGGSPSKKLVPVTRNSPITGEAAYLAAMQSGIQVLDLSTVSYMERVPNSILRSADVVTYVDENAFWVHRNRSYGRHTSPPVWCLFGTNKGYTYI